MEKQNLEDQLIQLINKPNTKSNPKEIGLRKGYMGHCIYFYIKYNFTHLPIHKKRADFFLEKTLQSINTRSPLDVHDGIAGIGFGIAYLVENGFIRGNLDTILQEIDDMLFKKIITITRSTTSMDKIADRLTNVLLYAVFRAKTVKDKDTKWIFENFVIQLINLIYQNHTPYFYTEPYPSTSNYPLVQYLLALFQTYKLGFYNFRIEQILKEMSVFLFTQTPLLHANRLMLLYVTEQLSQEIGTPGWDKYANHLRSQVSIEEILQKEMKDRQVFFTNGIGGVYLLLVAYNKISSQPIEFSPEIFYHRIQQSEVWELLKQNGEFFEKNAGLDGYLGLDLLLRHIEQIQL